MSLSISIIIPTLNEEKYIGVCLEHIKTQEQKPEEIIVVDACSKDKTIKIAKQYTDRIIKVDRRNIAYSRNIGASVSKSDILIFIDADILIKNNFIKIVSNLFKNDDDLGAISGIFKPVEKENNFLNRLITNYLINTTAKLSLLIKRPHITGGAFAVRKELFLKICGFNEELQTAEDTDIFRRLSKISKVIISNDLVIKTSMRRFKGLDWIYDWIIGSLYYEITGKSLVSNYKVKR